MMCRSFPTDDVFKILAECFPAIKNNHGLWLTDTSHRVRRGLAQSFILDGCTTATVQYIIDKVALIGHVGTLPEERGKHHARKLLYWIGEKLTADGFDVRLFARPHRVSYYEEIGFKKCGLDIVLERKYKTIDFTKIDKKSNKGEKQNDTHSSKHHHFVSLMLGGILMQERPPISP